MLFHVTMSHTEENCPIYNRERAQDIFTAFDKLEGLGKELKIKSHFFVFCGLSHIGFALLESDSLADISRYIFSVPLPQDIEIVPVQHMDEVVSMGKSITGRE